MKSLASDNFSGVHPRVMEALRIANEGHAIAYGGDPLTLRIKERIRTLFGGAAEVAFVFNGTGANIVALRSLLRPFEGVICAETAHINVDECGAPEWLTGSKLLPLPAPDGKLTVDQVRTALHGFGNPHHVQPKVLSISQATEYGTIYTREEISAVADLVHAKGMFLHVDGARIANAAAALGCSLSQLVAETGVDLLSLGGTKSGMMYGEAVVFLRKELAQYVPFYRKQVAQLASKMRYIAAQFDALLTDDLWLKNALHANRMAALLAQKVRSLPGVTLTQPVQVNAVFACIPKAAISVLQEKSFFWVWNQEVGEVRWMTSWDTTEQEIEEFVSLLSETLQRGA